MRFPRGWISTTFLLCICFSPSWDYRRTRSRLIDEKGSHWDGYVSVSDLETQAAAVGISPQQLMLALEQYEELLILAFDEHKTKVAFLEEARGGESDQEMDADAA